MDANTLGTIAGICTSVESIPQLIKIFKTKNVDDLSWLMIVVLITGLSLWVWYGIEKKELPIIYSNGFSLLINISLLICYLLYRNIK
ncbi:SemiSWEET transporter [Chryseobacterium sp.]|uniref:SemiSWEET transporter n=1 Tax=Chryseobacterium sp. TaxID=1871047 RepID=UPI00388EB3AB